MSRRLLVPAAFLFALGILSRPEPKPVSAAPAPAPTKDAKGVVGSNWSVSRGNAAQTGIADTTLPEKIDELWMVSLKGAIEGPPAIVDGVVYVATDEKWLVALELTKGKELWKTKLGPMRAGPSLKNGRIYIGDVDGKFYCVDATNGSVLWTFEAEGEISACANFAGENVLIPSHDATLYCLTPEGKKAWEFKTEGPVYGSVAVVDGKTFVAGCDSHLHVLDVADGKKLGSLDLRGQTGASAAVDGDRLYLGTMNNQVLAVDWKKLKIDWEFEAPKKRQPFYSSAALSGDLVILGSRDNKIWGIDKATGKDRWNFLTEHKVDGSAVVVGNRIFVGSFDRVFYVLDLKGNKVAEYPLDAAILGSPAVAANRVVICTEKGTVYCFGGK
jgi:outer membrane protein assembly factor BamB